MEFQKAIKKHKTKILLGILLLALVLRIKYNGVNEAVWWDEAEYLAAAKGWVFGIPYNLGSQRQPILPILVSLFYMLGIVNLNVIKFLVIALPSVAIVWLTYLLGKELYDESIGLIGAFFMSVFWLLLFWTARFATDVLGVALGLAAFYFFWKGYVKEKKKGYLTLTIIFLTLGALTRIGNLMFLTVIAGYLLLTDKLAFLKTKEFWIGSVIAALIIAPYIIWSSIAHGRALAFFKGYVGGGAAEAKLAKPLAFFVLEYFKLYPMQFLFVFFIGGMLTMVGVVLAFDKIITRKEKRFDADLFLILMMALPTAYLVFYERNGEPRWLMIMAPAIFFIVGKALLWIKNQAEKRIHFYGKTLGVVAILIVLAIGGYAQVREAGQIIESRKTSFAPVKEAALWMKNNTNQDEVIINSAVPQNSFYSERKTLGYPRTEEQFEELIKEEKPRYMVLSIFERSAEYAYSYPQRNQGKLKPVRVYSQPQDEQPILIIYEFKYQDS